MFRKQITILAVILLLCMPVFADTSDVTIRVDYSTNNVYIQGTSEDEWVTCYVESPRNGVVYIGSTQVRNGQVQISFRLDNPLDGVYTVYLKSDTMDMQLEKEFAYVTDVFDMRVVGYEYEQEMSNLSNLAAPAINNVHITTLNFIKGIYRLEIKDTDFMIDSRARNPFFFWMSDQGSFADISDDFRSVTFRADPSTKGNVRIIVGIGDGLGQTDRKVLILKGNDE